MCAHNYLYLFYSCVHIITIKNLSKETVDRVPPLASWIWVFQLVRTKWHCVWVADFYFFSSFSVCFSFFFCLLSLASSILIPKCGGRCDSGLGLFSGGAERSLGVGHGSGKAGGASVNERHLCDPPVSNPTEKLHKDIRQSDDSEGRDRTSLGTFTMLPLVLCHSNSWGAAAYFCFCC